MKQNGAYGCPVTAALGVSVAKGPSEGAATGAPQIVWAALGPVDKRAVIGRALAIVTVG